MQLIKILSEEQNKKSATAAILLGEQYETFSLNLTDWSLTDYLKQWQNAIDLAIQNRCTVALIKNYEKATEHVKMMWIYTIIPEEDAESRKFFNKDGSDFFITESFLFFTENKDLLSKSECFEEIYNSFGNYFPIYYFKEEHIKYFYLYLSPNISDVSHWKVSATTLSTITSLSINGSEPTDFKQG